MGLTRTSAPPLPVPLVHYESHVPHPDSPGLPGFGHGLTPDRIHSPVGRSGVNIRWFLRQQWGFRRIKSPVGEEFHPIVEKERRQSLAPKPIVPTSSRWESRTNRKQQSTLLPVVCPRRPQSRPRLAVCGRALASVATPMRIISLLRSVLRSRR